LTGQGSAAVAVVGHMPHLGGFAAWLLGAKDVELDMAKAGVAYFVCPEVVDKGSGKLTWLVTPEWLK
jgi:phosphohistidine phosphatase SixA